MAMLVPRRAAGFKAKVILHGSPEKNGSSGGHIDIPFFQCERGEGIHETGQIRVLPSGRGRDPLFPEVETLREMGYDVVMGSSRGIAMPAGVPSEIVDKFAEGMRKVVENPEFRKKCEDAYLPLVYMNPAEYKKHLQDLSDRLAKLWAEDPWIKD